MNDKCHKSSGGLCMLPGSACDAALASLLIPSSSRLAPEQSNRIGIHVDIVGPGGQARPAHGNHALRSDRVQVVDIHVAEAPLEIHDLSLARLSCRFGRACYITLVSPRGSPDGRGPTCVIVAEEGVVACSVNENIFRVEHAQTPGHLAAA